MDKSLFRYIWRHSQAAQLRILCLVLLALPIYFAMLTLPKDIVNGPIQGQGFEEPGETQPFLRIVVPDFSGGHIQIFGGFDLPRMDMLFALSFLFLGLYIASGGFKYLINTLKGQLGERLLRRLRYELSDRVLRFPLPYFRKVRASEVASMIKDEVEPLGGFIGDAFVHPAYQAGLAFTALAFILVQNVYLGLIALFVVVVQAFLIPIMRRPILKLGKQRQLTARQLAGRIGELVDGTTEIHTNDTSNYERADLTKRLGRIYSIRYEIFRRKFFVKFVNNFLAQLTPFLFYLVGGYFAIIGELDIGQLVAVIAAYKDLPPPIKELINWDQQRQDVQIKYEQVVENFDPDGMLPADLQRPAEQPPARLVGKIVTVNLGLADETGARLLDGVNLSFDVNERLAVVGPPGGGKDYVGLTLVRALAASSGTIRFGDATIDDLPEYVLGRRLAYAGSDPYMFPVSVRENIIYGLKHQPVTDTPLEGQDLIEAREAGNPEFNAEADWVNYEAAGVQNAEDLDRKLLELLRTVDLTEDIRRFGLQGTVDPREEPDLAAALLRARRAIAERLQDPSLAHLVEFFEPTLYNRNASLARNIVFGAPRVAAFDYDGLIDNAHFNKVIDKAGLRQDLLDMGLSIAETMVEIFSGLPADHPFFEQFSFIAADDLPEFQTLLNRVNRQGKDGLSAEDRKRLSTLPLSYVDARHRLGLITPEIMDKVLNARRLFRETLPAQHKNDIEFVDPDTYLSASPVEDNLLLGRIAYGQAGAEERVRAVMNEALEELGLTETVLRIGLTFDVGSGGKRLTGPQRQKIGLLRALIKRPDIFVANAAIALLDGATQTKVLANLMAHRRGEMGMVWVLARPEFADAFDRIVVIDSGKVVEQGSFRELRARGQAFARLLPDHLLAETQS